MPQGKTDGKTDTSGSAQGRFTVSIPDSLKPAIQRRADRISKAVEAEAGVGIDVSYAQVIVALIKQADERDKATQEAAS